jgi:hypothetical protein
LPLYPGSEEEEEFAEKWVAFLKADKVCQRITAEFGKTIAQVINRDGKDLKPNEPTLARAALWVAFDEGKGASSPRHA